MYTRTVRGQADPNRPVRETLSTFEAGMRIRGVSHSTHGEYNKDNHLVFPHHIHVAHAASKPDAAGADASSAQTRRVWVVCGPMVELRLQFMAEKVLSPNDSVNTYSVMLAERGSDGQWVSLEESPSMQALSNLYQYFLEGTARGGLVSRLRGLLEDGRPDEVSRYMRH